MPASHSIPMAGMAVFCHCAVSCAVTASHQNVQEAASFYKKFGFEEAETVKDYYKLADGRDALILSRSLAPPPASEQAPAPAAL